MTQPIGYNATWAYLEEKVGLPRRDSAFLEPALHLLEEVRARHAVVDTAYSDLPRAEKRNGRRFPNRAASTPTFPRRWHGDERTGAVARSRFASSLARMSLFENPHGRVVAAAVFAVDRPGGGVDEELRIELQRCLEYARRQIYVVGWEADAAEYKLAWEMHFLLGQLKLLGDGPLPVNVRWDF